MNASPADPGRVEYQPAAAGEDPPAPGDEYPQAIADDYPGWGVRHEAGRWTAWCPAVTVHASTGAGLRSAIEQAITGGADPLPGSSAEPASSADPADGGVSTWFHGFGDHKQAHTGSQDDWET